MDRPVLVCGFGRVGRRVLEYLRAAHLPSVLIDLHFDPAHVPGEVRHLTGDCRKREILTNAGIANARGVIVCTSDDLVNLSTMLTARSLNPDVRIVVRMFNQNLISTARQSGPQCLRSVGLRPRRAGLGADRDHGRIIGGVFAA